LQDAFARDTEDIGGDLGEVEEFSVKNAMDPILDVSSLSDKEVAQPNQLPEVAMMARHDPGWCDHPFEGQKYNRLRINLVGLLVRKCFSERCRDAMHFRPGYLSGRQRAQVRAMEGSLCGGVGGAPTVPFFERKIIS